VRTMKKINNKILIIGLAVLVGIFVISRLFRSPKLEGNIRKELVKLDTADISEIRMTTAGDQPKLIKLVREGGAWNAVQDDKPYPADKSAVNSLLVTISDLNAVRMVSRKKDKWETYNVGEKSTGVSVYTGGSVEAEFRVGKTGFNQTQGGQQFGGSQGIEAYTYVRMSDEDEVYMVNGFLEATFNRSLKDWRDKSFLRVSSSDVTKVSFRYPADSSFVIEKKDSVWTVAGRPAANNKVDSYLREFSSRSETSFADDFDMSSQPTFTIQFDGAAGPIATVDAWKQDEAWFLRSSRQPGVVFLNNDAGTMARLFAGAGSF
jgi:hypothetical protein